MASRKRELIDTGHDKRYVTRNADGTFKDSVDVGKSLAADRRHQAKSTSKPGYGNMGDAAKPKAKKTTAKGGKRG